MELLEGETLDEILARDGVFGAEETLLIGLDLARALSAVHAAGLLHRDIKSRNVLRERGGRIVLMDLSAGRIAEDSPNHRDGTGTPMYMAPEVLAGGAATVQSDLYGLGVVLYRLLAGAFPVCAGDLAGLRAAHGAILFCALSGDSQVDPWASEPSLRTILRASRPELSTTIVDLTLGALSARRRRSLMLAAFARELRQALGIERAAESRVRRMTLAASAVTAVVLFSVAWWSLAEAPVASARTGSQHRS